MAKTCKTRFTKMSKIAFIFLTIINGQSRAMDEWESWTLRKLEHEVSPSRWNPAKSPDQVVQEYVDSSIQGTLHAQETIPHELNVPYGSKGSQQWDLYGTDLAEDSPIYVWIHGGYWQEGSKDISAMFAPTLHSAGVRNIVLGYTLAPAATIPEIEAEVVQALSEIVKRYPHAPLTIGGHSAGAQLAAMLLHKEDAGDSALIHQIKGIHLISGVFDLRPLVPTYVNTPLKLTQTTAEASSPLKVRKIRQAFLDKGGGSDFSVFVTVGKYDSNLFQQQSQEYYKVLRKAFPQSVFWKSDSDDHFTLVENMAKAETEAGKQFGRVVDKVSATKLSSGARRSGGITSLSAVSGLALLLQLAGYFT